MIENDDIKKIFIIIPVYNEGQSIFDLLMGFYSYANQSFSSYIHELIIINDCSKDDSANWIKEIVKQNILNITYFTHSKNLGWHEAIKTGINSIKNKVKPDDVIITMDGDNTHNPFLIKRMLQGINEGADIVVASRFLPESRITGLKYHRILLSMGARFLYTLFWHLPGIKDYTCGYRAYRGVVFTEATNYYKDKLVQERNFTAIPEMLKKISKFSKVNLEVPLILKYSNKFNTSNMKIIETIILTLKMLIKN